MERRQTTSNERFRYFRTRNRKPGYMLVGVVTKRDGIWFVILYFCVIRKKNTHRVHLNGKNIRTDLVHDRCVSCSDKILTNIPKP